MFLILHLKENGTGGTYTTSPIFKIQVSATYPFHVLSPEPDIIAGIIVYWVCHTLFYLVYPHKPIVRWNTVLLILMRMTGFLPRAHTELLAELVWL